MSSSADQLFAAAEAMLRQRQSARAELLLRSFVQRFPADPRTAIARTSLAKLRATAGARASGGNAEPSREELARLIAAHEAGHSAKVLDRAEALLVRHPSSMALLGIVAAAQRSLGRIDAAIVTYRKMLALQPGQARIHYSLGALFQGRRRFEEAISSYRHAVALQPDFAEAHNNLGSTLRAVGRLQEAVACYQAALSIRPDLARSWNNLGTVFKLLERREDAISAFRKALAVSPDFADAHYNLGNSLQAARRFEEAIESYEQALVTRPDHAEALSNLGATLQEVGRLDEAIRRYDQALAVRPDYHSARSAKLSLLALTCDWDALAAEAHLIAGLGTTGDIISPFATLALEDAPERQRVRAERFTRSRIQQTPLPPHPAPSVRPARLRIGYFSADFKNHPVGRLLVRLIEQHDRSRCEIFGYSIGTAPEDELRIRFRRAFDHFADVHPLGDRQIAELARRDGIDVAIDLTGYTSAMRPGIFACRAAPVQISYLGYPGTMGAPFIDYIMADRTLIPDDLQHCYSERIIYLPDQYQAQDELGSEVEAPPRRTLGLPEDAFVFCAINNSYKLSAVAFDCWMELLRSVTGSVLWLYRSNEAVEKNLRMQAARRGIDPARLIFAGRKPYRDYVAQFASADLYLDSFTYNAGATASDALRAALPIITRPGRNYTARMAASLLSAIGLPELIARDNADYVRLALELARDPARLAELRARLARNRHAMALFDTARFTRAVEAAYQQAYDIFMRGQPLRDIRP